MDSTVIWKQGMAFETALDGHTFMMDLGTEAGGQDLGPRPKGLVLSALAGCTAMDVISILAKMRQQVTSFSVRAEGTTTDEHPKRFVSAVLHYDLEGVDLDLSKVRRAVTLSEERYCGVNATLAPTVSITREIRVNGELLVD